MKKVLLICLAIAAMTLSCSTNDDAAQFTNAIPQKSNPVDTRITPNIGDVIDVDVVKETDPTTVTGSIKLTIICKQTTYQGVAGDDWKGVGKDAAGNYYILNSTIDMSKDFNGKPVYKRHTRGYKYTGSGRPSYPC